MPVYDGKYVTNAEVRAAGIAISSSDDSAVASAIKDAERTIEMWTGRWFYKRSTYTMILDGTSDPYEINFSVPVIALTSLTIYGQVADPTTYIVMNRIGVPKDDRWNPRIVSNVYGEMSSYNVAPTIGIFRQGIQNISLLGDFGFVEDIAGTVPEQIKIAALKLTLRTIAKRDFTDTERELTLKQGMIVEEALPEYRYRLQVDKRKDAPLYTGDPEIDEIIETYRYKRFVLAV